MSANVPLAYKDIVDTISFESLPPNWANIDLVSFSSNVSLYDYQTDALKNTIKLLHYFFNTPHEYSNKDTALEFATRTQNLFSEAKKYAGILDLDAFGVDDARNAELFPKLLQFYHSTTYHYHQRISFSNFVNRMCFWMATGSGKTLILVKLIEILDRLKGLGLIPNNDILILTQRDDLIDQIKYHVDGFNKKGAKRITLWDLRRFDDVKSNNVLSFADEINVFIYRSDLISDETKEKLLGFEDVENGGKWYVLLDEAHKGDKEDSKRQLFYSVLARSGFLFNFSATFTHPWDLISTVYNFNLESFIESGYGKNVYLSQQDVDAFKDKNDFNNEAKQKIILKALILLTAAKKSKKTIERKIEAASYHNPLFVVLVNSVNTEDSDLEIFFRQIERIAHGDIKEGILSDAKSELIDELAERPRYMFPDDQRVLIDSKLVEKIGLSDVLINVFNTSSKGTIEVIKIPQNQEELIFKLKTSDKPFALIKIGDVSEWLKKKLDNYEISESYDNASYFRTISQDTNLANILMGSRAFYEGWDSNRPNVMVFINIGKGDARKYITQSIGRGVRIEPVKGNRKRLSPLAKDNVPEANNMLMKLDNEDISLIETLFVFGTNKRNVEQILESIKYEKREAIEILELEENEQAKSLNLLIPVYRDIPGTIPVEQLPKFEGNRLLLSNFLKWVDDHRVVYTLYSQNKFMQPLTIERINSYLSSGAFEEVTENGVLDQLDDLIAHVNVELQEIDKFKRLQDEIVHFKRIQLSMNKEDVRKLKSLIQLVKAYKKSPDEEKKLKELHKAGKIDIEKYTEEIKKLGKISSEEDFRDLKIKYIANHYYFPVILSNKDKIDYINHIIDVESERVFIEQLEEYMKRGGFKNFDWWMFSKLDEHLDQIYIPYYNKMYNTVAHFKPDFIFWMAKGNNYYIAFADPKGTTHTDYEYKVDGYKRLFETKEDARLHKVDKENVRVYLFLFTDDKNKLSEAYRKYWFDRPEQMEQRIGQA